MNMPELNAELVKLDNAHAKLSWLVFEGDWGGQIYLTVRADLLGDGFDSLPLLTDMDNAAWPNNGPSGRYEQVRRGGNHDDKHVIGGMGGGKLTDGVWVHKEFNIAKWRKAIRTALKLDKSTRISH